MPAAWPAAGFFLNFKSGLPPVWDASETEVVRATLVLARVVREAILEAMLANRAPTLAMTPIEVTFSCMKVLCSNMGRFMARHLQAGKTEKELFRDDTVGELMKALLLPCTLGASLNGLSASAASNEQDELELAATRFLGTWIPFF